MYRIADVDYKKLAKCNARLAHWIDLLKSKMIGDQKRVVMQILRQTYKLNYLYYVKFFKQHKDLAAKILGPGFKKDYKNLFYAEQVENDLIQQYIPAIFKEMTRGRIVPDLREDCKGALLLGLRESVWKYSREEIKFVTYAIKGIQNNVIFFKRQNNKSGKEDMPQHYFIEDIFPYRDTYSHDSLEILIDQNTSSVDQINIRAFIKSIHAKADLSYAQLRCVLAYLDGKLYDTKTLRRARDKITLYISENRESLPEMEEVLC